MARVLSGILAIARSRNHVALAAVDGALRKHFTEELVPAFRRKDWADDLVRVISSLLREDEDVAEETIGGVLVGVLVFMAPAHRVLRAILELPRDAPTLLFAIRTARARGSDHAERARAIVRHVCRTFGMSKREADDLYDDRASVNGSGSTTH